MKVIILHNLWYFSIDILFNYYTINIVEVLRGFEVNFGNVLFRQNQSWYKHGILTYNLEFLLLFLLPPKE